MKACWFLMIVILSVFSCNSPSKQTPAKKTPADKQNATATSHVYYYFPKSNVYFDTTARIIYYFDSTKKGWQTAHSPKGIQSDLGKGAVITNPSQPVWANNKEHRLEYSVELYADSADFKGPKPVKKTQVAKPQPQVQQEKKKSSVKRFFDKIFHRRRGKDHF